MALVSPYNVAKLHENSRQETVELVSALVSSERARDATPSSQVRRQSNGTTLGNVPPETFFASLLDHEAIFGQDDTPSVEACAVHLELLETFMVLRRKVLLSNGLYFVFGTDHRRSRGSNLDWGREENWTKFVRLAVARFKIWWEMYGAKHADRQPWSTLPPLDVLMVLHAFILNTKEFNTLYADTTDKYPVLSTKFPWELIVRSSEPLGFVPAK